MNKRDNAYLFHIVLAISKIEKYLERKSFAQFSKSDLLTDAVARELSIIGEASKNFSADFRKKYPELPYRDMADLRNFLIHKYFNVSLRTVWDTCKNDLPELKKLIEPLAK